MGLAPTDGESRVLPVKLSGRALRGQQRGMVVTTVPTCPRM